MAKEGARVADSPDSAVRGAEVAITMLANDQAVRDAMLAPAQQAGAAIDALPNGAIHMCTSTISVALSKELAEKHAARSQGYVAAPVLGRPDAAAQKKLWIIAAGPPADVQRWRPLMEATGRAVTVMGEQAWRANLNKIAVNFMLEAQRELLFASTSGRLSNAESSEALGKYAVSVCVSARWVRTSAEVLRRTTCRYAKESKRSSAAKRGLAHATRPGPGRDCRSTALRCLAQNLGRSPGRARSQR